MSEDFLTYHDYMSFPDIGKCMACPVCEDFSNVHFLKPEYIKGFDQHKAWMGRGDAIKIPCYCEEGHIWIIRLGAHKGSVYVKLEDIKSGDYFIDKHEDSIREAEFIAFYKAGYDAGRDKKEFDHHNVIKMYENLKKLNNGEIISDSF